MNTLYTCLSSAAGTIAAGMALTYLSRLKERTWDEYYPNLRAFDWQEAKILFDHEEEDRLRSFRDEKQFRRDQRARLDLAIEMVGRAYHDNRLSREWCKTEWCDMVDHHLEYEPTVVEAMELVLEETKRFRRIALFDLVHMRLLSLLQFDRWGFGPVPSVVARRKVFGADVLQVYERVRQAAANFARLAYSEEEAQLVLAKM